MKNLHILPTDKPSKLSDCHDNKLHLDDVRYLKNYLNIYITSDEQIKDGEYGVCLNLIREGFKSHQAVFKMDSEQRQAMENLGGQVKAEVLKVVLTTDQDLIKNGVQAIDDEFLEWFVKNPNCREIEVVDVRSLGVYGSYYPYKIIIPKEDTKQETLEETAENYEWRIKTNSFSDNVKANELAESSKQDFIAGAKWQAERSYSEEEVGELVYNIIGEYGKHYGIMIDGSKLNELFEQFKKE